MTTTPETTNTTPAAWIGCLSCYNNGQLRGQWITAHDAINDQDDYHTPGYKGLAEFYTTPAGTIGARCVYCGGDEFDVFDTEHLPHKMTAAEFYKHAETLAELDDAGNLERITALAGFLGMETLDELITYDENNYAGQWDTFQEFAEQYLDDVGDLAAIPERLAYYFDYEKYARDLAHSYLYDDATGHTWASV